MSTMLPDRRKSWMAVAIAAYAIFCISFVITGIVKPAWDWDMLAYIAETLEEQPGATPETIHRDTYDIVQARVSEEDWRMLTTINDYRVEQVRNPASFMSMLGMYRIKLGYELVLKAVSRLIDPASATLLISLVAGVALTVMIGIFLVRQGQPELLFLSIPILILAELPLLARSPTPDMLATVFLVGGLMAFLRARDWLAATLFVTAVAVRPDYVVFVALLAGAFLLLRRWPPRAYFAAFAGSIAVYAIAVALADYPGWWRHFFFALVELQPTMDGFDPPFSLSTYVDALARGVVKVLGWQPWPWVAAGSIFTLLYFRPLRDQLQGRMLVLFAALTATLVVKFLLFPIMDARIYQALVIGLLLLVAETTARLLKDAPATSRIAVLVNAS